MEHLQTPVSKYTIQGENYEIVDPHTLEPTLYEKTVMMFDVDGRKYTIPIWASKKIPASTNVIDIRLRIPNPSQYFEFQLDLRKRKFLLKGYCGSKAIDLNNRDEMRKIEEIVLTDTSKMFFNMLMDSIV